MSPIETLGWTLLHFLWQGTLIGASLLASVRLLRHSTSRVRYVFSCGALVLMLLCALATFLSLQSPSARIVGVVQVVRHIIPGMDMRATEVSPSANFMASGLSLLVLAWSCGVMLLCIRLLGGSMRTHRFTQVETASATAIWQQRFSGLMQRLAITGPVQLVISAVAEAPAVVGWLSPVVLVPVGVLSGLSIAHVEALIAHELAHVKRHDYLVNLLQIGVETLLFYHPAVWYVSRMIREERENCCDDLAVRVCGDRLTYARALTELEALRRGTAAPDFAMTAYRGSLVGRVQRLLKPQENKFADISPALVIFALVVGMLVAGIGGSVRGATPLTAISGASKNHGQDGATGVDPRWEAAARLPRQVWNRLKDSDEPTEQALFLRHSYLSRPDSADAWGNVMQEQLTRFFRDRSFAIRPEAAGAQIAVACREVQCQIQVSTPLPATIGGEAQSERIINDLRGQPWYPAELVMTDGQDGVEIDKLYRLQYFDRK
jgi:beta-lactamase regulating signal transducer with metallopeptidase domain